MRDIITHMAIQYVNMLDKLENLDMDIYGEYGRPIRIKRTWIFNGVILMIGYDTKVYH